MATLAADSARDYQLGDREDYPVIAADTIFEGAAVGENASGYARPLAAGDAFLGFAERQADNSDGSAGDVNVTVKKRGSIVLSVTGATVASNDRVAVYASDDDTFTTTATSNSLVGYVSRWISGTQCVVEFDALAVKAALQV
jgi:hypothetical protein